MIKTQQILTGIRGLVESNQALTVEYKALEFNSATKQVMWLHGEANVRKSVDWLTFCCAELAESIFKRIRNVREAVESFPDFANLYTMVTTDLESYFEQMKNIITLCL